jgi:ADP-heptose:LPS heptosyltransferase
MSCLIIKNDGIGDLILASGLIAAVGEHYNGKVDLVTCAANQEIAEGIVPLRNRYYVSRDGLRIDTKRYKAGIFPFLRQKKVRFIPSIPDEDMSVSQALSEQQYDSVVCLRRFIRQSSLVLMQQVRSKKKYCAWQYPTNACLDMAEQATHGWEHYEGESDVLSELSYNKAFLEKVLKTTLSSQPRLSFCQKQEGQVATRKIALGLGGNSTNWSFGDWIELCMRLSSVGWKMLLLGGNDAAELAEKISFKVPDAENRVGQLSWQMTADTLSRCEGYVGNDTGLSHFASLILDKCLTILGGGTFRRFYPWPGAMNQYAIYHGLDCFDCTWECKFQDRFCLSLVQPRDVEKYFGEIMSGEADSERDLNTHNEKYPLKGFKDNNSFFVSVRPR